jgi:hypothetical protein
MVMNNEYRPVEELKEILFVKLKREKFKLDCGHKVTLGEYLANNIVIQNDSKRIECTDCYQ